jgi:hypothetical protein
VLAAAALAWRSHAFSSGLVEAQAADALSTNPLENQVEVQTNIFLALRACYWRWSSQLLPYYGTHLCEPTECLERF